MLTAPRAALLLTIATAALSVQLPDPPLPTHDVEIIFTEGASYASASPDRRWVAFDLLGSVWLIPFNGGTAKKITPDSLQASHPTWSPDSTRVAFSALTDDGGLHIASIDLDGTDLTQLTDGPFDDSRPVWNDEGVGQILFRSDRGAELSVWELIPGDRTLRPAGDVDPDKFDLFQKLANDEELRVRDGRIFRRTGGRNGSDRPVDFRATVKLKRTDYVARHRLLEPVTPQRLNGMMNPVLSRDGSKIAFTALGDLWVQSFPEPPVQITNDEFLDLDPAWSPDGGRLAFSTDRSGTMEIWVHDLRSGSDIQLTGLNPRAPDQGKLGAAWSPDGTRIAFRRDEHWSTITLLGAVPRCRPPSTPGVILTTLGGVGRPTWGIDSCTLAVSALFPYRPLSTRGLNQIVVHDLQTGDARPEVLFPDHSIGDRRDSSPVWSPNGFNFALIADGRLWSVGVDATGKPVSPLRMLADDLPESPSWESDSEHVVYQTPAGMRRTTGEVPEAIGVDMMWAPSIPPDRTIVHAGRFFDGQNEDVRYDVDITIDRGVVRSIEPHDDTAHRGTVIDASSQFVMPGFIDPHVRLDPAYGEALGRIFLAYGVTTVRDANLNTYAGVEQQESLGNGRRIGPRVFITGDPFDGRRVMASGGVSIGSPEALDAALRRAALLNADARYARERFAGPLERLMVDDAHRRGLRAATNSFFSAMAFGYDELDEPITGAEKEKLEVISKSRMFWAPTLNRIGFSSSVRRDPSILRDPRLLFFPPSELTRYRRLADAMEKVPIPNQQRDERLVQRFRDGVASVFKKGGRIVAASNAGGADRPFGVEFDPFGLGLHVELEQLVLSGMTPFQALQAATITAADAIGVSDAIGTLEIGKLGDMVFLGGDPLQDITKTRDVRAVMRGGRYYDLAALGVQQPPR